MKNAIVRKLNLFIFCSLAAFMVLVSSCDKEEIESGTCFADATTVRKIQNKPAKVTAVGSQFYLVEENTIDTRLNPCNLGKEFQVNNLLVIVSGNVKTTAQTGVCCTDNFVITHISRR